MKNPDEYARDAERLRRLLSSSPGDLEDGDVPSSIAALQLSTLTTPTSYLTDAKVMALAQLTAGIGHSLSTMMPSSLSTTIADAAKNLDHLITTNRFGGPKLGIALSNETFREGALFRALNGQIRPYLNVAQEHSGLLQSSGIQAALEMDRIWKAWEAADLVLNNQAPRLAEFGWTLPMQMDTPTTLEVLAENDRERIDAHFVEFYTFDENSWFNELKANVLESDRFSPWAALLRQCFDAYERDHFLICVPSLLSIMEGGLIVKDDVRKLDQRFFERKIAELRPGSIVSAAWKSIAVFFRLLFQNAEFQSARPEFINRHWVLHGRDFGSWSKADALRLFHALDTVSSIKLMKELHDATAGED